MALDLRVGNKYRLTRKIGSGSFGDIYLGEAMRRRRVLLASPWHFDPPLPCVSLTPFCLCTSLPLFLPRL